MSNNRSPEKRAALRRIATEFVEKVNAETFCYFCGKQPIEWHRSYHDNHPNARVSSLRTQGCSIKRIEEEMWVCIPLCRSCHMSFDGRIEELIKTHPYKKGVSYVGALPCSCCERLIKPLRRGMCTGCYNHHQGLRLRKTSTCGCCVSTEES